jgi:hypothetical protein
MVTPDTVGNYIFSLTVQNNIYTSLPDVVSVQVSSITPEPPIADAGDDILSEDCTVIQLSALNSSDTNNDELFYHWSVMSKPSDSMAGPSSFSDVNDPLASFVGDVQGDYTIALYVDDGNLWSQPDFTIITLVERVSNTSPEIIIENSSVQVEAGTAECQEPLPGECSHSCDECPSSTINLADEVLVSDYDGDLLNYQWTVISGECSDSQFSTRSTCEDANKTWIANAVVEDPSDLLSQVTINLDAPAGPTHCAIEEFTFQLEAMDCPGALDRQTVTYELSCCGNDTSGPQSNGNTCCYDIAMTDTFGDGWNGASISASVNGTFYETYTVSSGNSGSGQLCLTDGSMMELSWNSGTWDSEVGFTVTDPSGAAIFNHGPNPVVGLLYCDTAVCP